MEIVSKINNVLLLQKENKRSLPVGIVLKNGNLQVKAFKIMSFDSSKEMLEGLTRLEIYSSMREKREPVICRFRLSEIKDIICEELEYQTV